MGEACATKVLLVDDDPLVLAAASCVLARRGLRTISAVCPFNVRALVRQERPDVLVLDCEMAGIDGARLLEQLRADPGTAAIPVLFYSGNEDVPEIARSLGVGYASKWCGLGALADAIFAALRAGRGLEKAS